MSVWYHLTNKSTGEKQIVGSLGGYEVDQFDVVELDRQPNEFEKFVDGELVTDQRLKANTQAGAEHIAEAHLTKYIEALLVKSGVTLDAGLLFQEADLEKRDIHDLADDVMDKRKAFEDQELTRQKAQTEGI